MTAESTKHRRLVRFNDGLLVSFQAPGVRASYGHKHATFTEQGQKTKNTSSCLLSNSAADQAGPSHTGTVECTRLKQACMRRPGWPPQYSPSQSMQKASVCRSKQGTHSRQPSKASYQTPLGGTASAQQGQTRCIRALLSLSLGSLLPPKPSGRHYNFCCSQEEARRGGM